MDWIIAILGGFIGGAIALLFIFKNKKRKGV